jgi:hypothetical protein
MGKLKDDLLPSKDSADPIASSEAAPAPSAPSAPEAQVEAVKPVEPAPGQKMVSVTPRDSFGTSIGGIWYSFVKGQAIQVPENVKQVLKETDKL